VEVTCVERRLAERRLPVQRKASLSAVAAFNAGRLLALIADDSTVGIAIAFAELLGDCCAEEKLSIGTVVLHEPASALLRVGAVLQPEFAADFLLILAEPRPESLRRHVDDFRTDPTVRKGRLIAALRESDYFKAQLSPAAKRLITPIRI
jgi:hypothetical protein